MTRDRKREELDRLLAQGRLSGPSRDRILADVLDAQPRRRWPRVALWVSSLSAAAAMLALLVFGRVPPGFRARGGGGGPQLEVGCVQGELAACPTGSTLLFRVTGAVEGGFLVAYAESMDADGGSGRVWYFPLPTGLRPS